MNKKISFPIAIIIIAILAVLVGGLAGWQYLLKTPAETELSEIGMPPDRTANWKTYRNEKYGFEFNYPLDYSLKEEDRSTSPDDFDDFWEPIQYLKVIYIAGHQISVGVSKNDNNLSVNEWLDYMKSAPPVMEVFPDQNRKIIYISGVEGIDTMRFECCLGCKREIYLPKNSKIYSLKIQGSIECEQKEKRDTQRCCFIEEHEIAFDKILSTFKFLE